MPCQDGARARVLHSVRAHPTTEALECSESSGQGPREGVGRPSKLSVPKGLVLCLPLGDKTKDLEGHSSSRRTELSKVPP